MGCSSSTCTTDEVSPVPSNKPLPNHQKVPTPRRRSQGCGHLLCLSGSGVDIPERSTSVKKITVQSKDGKRQARTATIPRGRVFEICDAAKPDCNGRSKNRPLPKIPELDEDPEISHRGRSTRAKKKPQVPQTIVEKFSDSCEEDYLPGSSVPKLPPLFTPRPLPPAEDGEVNVLNQTSWDHLVKKKRRRNGSGTTSRQDPELHVVPRPESRTEITRDFKTFTRSPRKNKMNHKNRILWKASYDTTGRLSNICDVAFLHPDCIAVSQDCENKSGLQLYDIPKAGLPGNVIGDPELCSPRGICLDRDGHVVVTDAHTKTVKFMDTSGNYLASWKHGKFSLPAGIAHTREGQFVVSDEPGGNKAIGIYSGRGTVIRKFGMPWFDCPWYVAVDNYNRILVSEQSVSGVIVFDNHGRFLFKFGSYGGGEGQLNFQSGIAIDSKNQILVADSDNYRVCLYSADGYFIENVVTHLPSRPVSLALYESQSLLAVVTDSEVFLHQMNSGSHSPRY